MPGMLARFSNPLYYDRHRVCEGDAFAGNIVPATERGFWYPDITDPATLGCLLVIARLDHGCSEVEKGD